MPYRCDPFPFDTRGLDFGYRVYSLSVQANLFGKWLLILASNL